MRFLPSLFRRLLAWLFLTSMLAHASGADLEWDGLISLDVDPDGLFDAAGNWNIGGITATAPPTTGDTATFDVNDTYTVTFTQNEASDLLSVLDGEVMFISDSAVARAYTLATGAADANISGGTLAVGQAGAPIQLGLGDIFGSALTIGNGAAGALTVSGPGSTLNASSNFQTHVVGDGADGNLSVVDGAQATLGGSTPLNVGVSATDATTGAVVVNTGGSLDAGDLLIATDTSLATGDVTVNGNASTVGQLLAADLTVGSVSGGAGTISVENGGEFSTGTGAVTVNATGTISIDNTSTLNLNGNTVIDGGHIQGPGFPAPTLNLGANVTVDVINSGLIDVNALRVDAGATINLNSGGDLLQSRDNGLLEIGVSTPGAITLDGSGTRLEGATLTIGRASGSGVATLENNSMVLLGGLMPGFFKLGDNSGSQAELNVLSGSTVAATVHEYGTIAVGGATATVLVDGTGSRIQGSSVLMGRASGGTVTVNIENGGEIVSGFDFVVRTTATMNVGLVGVGTLSFFDLLVDGGTINIGNGGVLNMDADDQVTIQNAGLVDFASNYTVNGGATFAIRDRGVLRIRADLDVDDGTVTITDFGEVVVDGDFTTTANGVVNLNGGTIALDAIDIETGGTFNFSFGTLNFVNDLTIAPGDILEQALGGSHTLPIGKELRVDGETTLDGLLEINGGAFYTSVLNNPHLMAFQSGTLGFTGAGGLTIGGAGPLGDEVVVKDSQTIEVTNTATIETGASLELQTGGTFTAATLDNLGGVSGAGAIDATLVNGAAGELFVGVGEQLRIRGNGHTNAGQFTLASGTLRFDGDVTNESSGLILGAGAYRADAGTTNDGTMAFSATANVIGDVTNNASGLITSSGGTTTFFDDVVNNGEIRTNANSFTVYFGSYSGAGDTGSGTVILEGDLKPGSSPGLMAFGGDLAFGSAARLEIELSGLAPGAEHDQVTVADSVALDGAIDVLLTDDFAPALGDTFVILTAAGGLSGAFAQAAFPELPLGAGFELVYRATSVELIVVSSLPGDYNNDGLVDAADYTVWRDNEGMPAGTLLNDTNGDVIGTAQYETWVANYGATAAQAVAVPEPAAAILLFSIALAGLPCVRRIR